MVQRGDVKKNRNLSARALLVAVVRRSLQQISLDADFWGWPGMTAAWFTAVCILQGHLEADRRSHWSMEPMEPMEH